jgi:protoporphyrinogen oxidase
MDKKITIIGAGASGLACAYSLSRHKIATEIIEKDVQVAGMCKTYCVHEEKIDDYFLIEPPHRFFSKNKELYVMIEKLLGYHWNEVQRKTQQYIHGKMYDYPINVRQAFKNLGMGKSAKIALSYLKEKIIQRKVHNLKAYEYKHSGKTLAEFNIINYTEKLWGMDCSEIDAEWAIQRIRGLNLIKAIKGSIINKKKIKSLVDSFYFPTKGTQQIYTTMLKKSKSTYSLKLHLETYPFKIFHSDNRIIKVHTNNGIFNVDHLVESIPIDEFVELLDPAPPKKVLNAVRKLQWRSQVYLILTLDREKVTDNQWIYFPAEAPFGRVTEANNFSKAMSPKGNTSLFIEFFCDYEDEIWDYNSEQLLQISFPYLKHLIDINDVMNAYAFRARKVYPIYKINYKEHLDIVKEYLDKFENLHYIGRLGRFVYTNQDHSLEMGLETAKSIINNVKVNLDNIGQEKEYQERGDTYDRHSINPGCRIRE